MRKIPVLGLFLATIAIAVGLHQPSYAGKPTIAAPCKQCHQPADDMVRGTMVGVSEKFKTIQIAAGSVSGS